MPRPTRPQHRTRRRPNGTDLPHRLVRPRRDPPAHTADAQDGAPNAWTLPVLGGATLIAGLAATLVYAALLQALGVPEVRSIFALVRRSS